jgi:hypothetical protein
MTLKHPRSAANISFDWMAPRVGASDTPDKFRNADLLEECNMIGKTESDTAYTCGRLAELLALVECRHPTDCYVPLPQLSSAHVTMSFDP